MKKEKLFKIITFSLLILLVVLFIIKACPILMQNDTLYDIKLGERYMTTGMFKIDDYSFHEGLVYQTHHYLVCIIDYIIYSLFSFDGLYVLMVLLLSLITLLFYQFNKMMMKNKFLMYILLFFQIIAISPFVSLRAQMYSYIIFMLEILLIEKYLNNNKKDYLILLSIIPLLLINLHSGVIYFYFIIMATYLLNHFKINYKGISSDKRVNKKVFNNLIKTSVTGALLTTINPYGIDGITYGLKTLNSEYIGNYITEFQTPNLFTPMGILIILYVLACILCMICSKRKTKIHELLLLFGTIFMTSISVRHFSLLVITSVVVLPHIEDIYRTFDKKEWDLISILKKHLDPMKKVIISFYILILFYLTFFLITRDKVYLPKEEYPISAVNYINEHIDKQAHIFNQYEWGSYLLFNDTKTFIDSRCDLFNAEYNNTSVMKDYVDVMYNDYNYSYIVQKYNVDYFLLHKNSMLSKIILSDPNYEVNYSDNISIVIKKQK